MTATNISINFDVKEYHDSRSKAQSLVTYNAKLLGREITCITTDNLLERVHESCIKKEKIVVSNYNVNSFNISIKFPWFLDFLQTSEIAHIDGFGIIYALRFMGYILPKEYRVSYSKLMPRLLDSCDQKGYSIYFLGAKPELLNVAIANLRQQYPNAVINGHHGYFDYENEESNQVVIDDINHHKPNILIVGMGMPLQEYWVHNNRDLVEANSILLGGAVIDRMAGAVPECPQFLSNSGLEWLFRLIREPKRLLTRYALGNTAFVLQIALAKFT